MRRPSEKHYGIHTGEKLMTRFHRPTYPKEVFQQCTSATYTEAGLLDAPWGVY